MTRTLPKHHKSMETFLDQLYMMGNENLQDLTMALVWEDMLQQSTTKIERTLGCKLHKHRHTK